MMNGLEQHVRFSLAEKPLKSRVPGFLNNLLQVTLGGFVRFLTLNYEVSG